MRYIFLFLFITSSTGSIASIFDDCPIGPENPSSSTTDIQKFMIPNCANSDIEKSAELGNLTPLCVECRKKFSTLAEGYSVLLPSPPTIDVRRGILEEFKKSLSAQILDISKLRSLHQMNTDFKEANSACNTENLCPNNSSISSELDNLKVQLANELKNLLSPTIEINSNGILNRSSNAKSCQISDQEMMKAQSLVFEDEISNDSFISQLSSLPQDEGSFHLALEDFLENKMGKQRDLFVKHPILSRLAKDPIQFLKFFRSIQKPVSPDGFRKALYESPSLSANIDHDIAQSCNKAIGAFKDLYCSGRASFRGSSIDSLLPLSGDDLNFTSNKNLTADLSELNPSKKILSLCSVVQSSNPKDPDLSGGLKDMQYSLAQDYARSSFNRFKTIKYDSEISEPRELVCSDFEKPIKCEMSDSLDCKYFKKIKGFRDPKSSDFRLAQSTDPNLNSVLRRLIGNPSPKLIPLDSRTILISQGIIPQGDGTLASQPDVPERHKDYFSSGSAATASAQSTRSAPAAVASNSVSPAASRAAPTSIYQPSPTTNTNSPDSDPASSELSNLDQSKLGDIQSEILRRTSAAPKAAPLSASQVRQIVQDEAARRQVPLTQAQTTAFASQIQSQAQAPQGVTGGSLANNSAQALSDDNSNAVTRSGAQRLNDQRQAALGGMAGASGSRGGGSGSSLSVDSSGSGRSPASVTNASIALNVSGDAKNLSDVIKQKLELNDPEANQLKAMIESHRDFTLKLLNTTVDLSYVEGQGYRVASSNISADVRNQISAYLNQYVIRNPKATLENLKRTIITQ